MKLVEVTWDDAQGTSGWRSLKEIEHNPDRITSAGYLIRRDSEGITICQSWGSDDRIADTLFVPAGYVRKVKVIRA